MSEDYDRQRDIEAEGQRAAVYYATQPEMDWSRLTQNHRFALAVLVGTIDPVEPQEPNAFRRALHDLWGFKLAQRHVRAEGVAYTPTDLGYRVHDMLKGPSE